MAADARSGCTAVASPSRPSVHVMDCWAHLPQVSNLNPLVLQGTIPVIKAAIGHLLCDKTRIHRSYTELSPPLPHPSARPRTACSARRSSLRPRTWPPSSKAAFRVAASPSLRTSNEDGPALSVPRWAT